MEGLHLDYPIDQGNPETLKRRSHLWWTIYILDQRISFSLGGPMSVSDEIITVPILSLNDSTQRDAMLGLHVKVSRLICNVLKSK
jgi:proline utilization trans-activator